jgi:pyruvate,orthophosphate dikinase
VIYGEYLANAQGEDVVAGVRTPKEIAELERDNKTIYDELITNAKRLEDHYKDMQDIEFTIEKNKLFILQCRSGKRTGTAAIRIAVEMVSEGFITREKAVAMVAPGGLEQALHPRLKNTKAGKVIAKGLNAGPGGAVGKAVFSRSAPLNWARAVRAKLLFVLAGNHARRLERVCSQLRVFSPVAADALATRLWSRRQFGIPTICWLFGHQAGRPPCHAASPHPMAPSSTKATGSPSTEPKACVYPGRSRSGKRSSERRLQHADGAGLTNSAPGRTHQRRHARPGAAAVALGAEGHRPLPHRAHVLEEDPLADRASHDSGRTDEDQRQAALDELLPIQREDFVGIFRAMGEKPVTVRLIDPPLHEFLPNQIELAKEVAVEQSQGKNDADKVKLLNKVNELHEQNPMLGLRGCRLSIVFPGIVEMQVAAIIGAAAQVKKEGVNVHPEIMIPLVATSTS